jgi:hypothetical protein
VAEVRLQGLQPSVLGGERRGEWGVKGGDAALFLGEEGSSWRRPVGLSEEEDGRAH